MTLKDKHTSTGFQTPPNYFNTLEERIFNCIDTPKTGFKTPDHYFEHFVVAAPKKAKVFSLKTIAYSTSIAAMLLLSIFVFLPKNTTDINFNNIEYTALESYINSDNIDFTTEDLIELYAINNQDIDQIDFLTIQDNILFKYLSDNTIDDDYADFKL